MKWRILLALTAGALSLTSGTHAGAEPASTPVLVELFTSEGCSSCPPADAVLEKLVRDQPVPGARVVALAHHVDYWNELGWPDPFSSASATDRQRTYGGNYTPQAVVDGQAEAIGSRQDLLEATIATAAKRPHVPIALAATPNGNSWEVTVNGPSDTYLAVVQNRARVAVPKGENAGKTLGHIAIVRSLQKVAGKTMVALPAPIAAPDGSTFSLVAFSQDRQHRIVGTATLALR